MKWNVVRLYDRDYIYDAHDRKTHLFEFKSLSCSLEEEAFESVSGNLLREARVNTSEFLTDYDLLFVFKRLEL